MMQKHTWAFSHETATDHVFACSICGTVIGFNKPGIGEPTADLTGETPAPPPEADDYVGPCNEETP